MIPYLISLFGLAIPLFALEFTLGQGTGKSSLGAFLSLDRRLGGLGLLTMVSTCGVAMYSNVVLAWCMHYLASITGALGTSEGLPWKPGHAAAFYQGEVLHKSFKCHNAITLSRACTSPEEVTRLMPEERIWTYDQSVLALANGCTCHGTGFEKQGDLQGDTVACLFVVYLIVFSMGIAGTKSMQYAMYLTVPLPYLLLVCIFFRGITLPGAMIGIEYYLKPDLSRLFVAYTDSKGETRSAGSIWLEAASSLFFSLGLAQGNHITYASYNARTFPVMPNVLTVALINSGTELFAGFCVFSILGYLAEQRGVPIQDVARGGPGLVFEVIAEALSLMPSKQAVGLFFF